MTQPTKTSATSAAKRVICVDLSLALKSDGEAGFAPGFRAFLAEQREFGTQLFFLKQSGASFDDETLRRAGFFEPTENGGCGLASGDILIAANDDEALGKLKARRISHCIVGDERLVGDARFPAEAQPVILSAAAENAGYPVFPDWGEIANFFNWADGFAEVGDRRLARIKPIKERGENFVYKLEGAGGGALILKHRFERGQESRNRFRTEAVHLSALREAGLDCVPELKWRRGDWALYAYIEGRPVESPGADEARQLADFLLALDQRREALRAKNLELAVGARLRLGDYAVAINALWDRIFRACQGPGGSRDTLMFMLTDLEQLRQDNINHFYLWQKREGWDLEAVLPEEQRFFSPVDFGLHNAVRTPGGRLAFFDFELSGWDDPAKLMADFFHNTEQQLPLEHKIAVLEAFSKNRDHDPNFLKRFFAVADLAAVEWILKTLEIAIPEKMRRLQFLVPKLDGEALLRERLALAADMRERFQPMETLCKHSQLLDSGGEI